MAKNNVQSVSYLLCTQVIKPKIIHKPQNHNLSMAMAWLDKDTASDVCMSFASDTNLHKTKHTQTSDIKFSKN